MYYNVNTLGIHFIQGKLRRHHFEAILDKVMGIPDTEIEGLDVRSDTRFIFKIKHNIGMNRFVNALQGEIYSLNMDI